jgi:hypothetical protein
LDAYYARSQKGEKMIDFEQAELSVFRQIEQLLKTAKDSLLTDIVPDGCNCSNSR